MENNGELIIYKSRGGEIKIETHLKDESIWLTQKDMVDLFATDQSVVSRHINNIYSGGELDRKSNMQKMHIANSDKKVNYYNLDTIISVGYRVNSQKATDFRVWATKTLRNYLVKGYVVNEQRLLEQGSKLKEAQKLLTMIAENSNNTILLGHEKELLDVIADYARSWKILGQFDEDKIEVKKFKKTKFQLNYYKCRDIIDGLKEDLIAKKLVGDLFGQEISARLEGILGNLYQTYGGEELYPSIEEKAAHLLYFVIKDHPFFDGNKRIGSLLFLYFLEKNSFLFKENGVTKISDKTIVALALLVASSNPKEKDLLVSLIINLIQD